MSANLPKLLRTLKEYEGRILLVPSYSKPRILVKKNWEIINEHAEPGEAELCEHIAEVLGAKTLENLENGLEISLESDGARFLFTLRENKDGKILAVQKLADTLPNIKNSNDWENISNWIKTGHGILFLNDQSIYAALLKFISQQKNGLIVSLERSIKYPAKSYLGLIEQREFGEHFEILSEALRESCQNNAFLIGINELRLNDSEKKLIEKIAEKTLVLILPDTFSEP